MSKFSTLIIRDCALSTLKEPISISLKATPSFPACAYDYIENPHPVPDSWAPRGVSTGQETLDVALLERLSEGRMGVAYRARVVSATADDGSPITNVCPGEVCVKFAKPEYCRSLAREAWFYEQLAECQGISVAQCHGFFSSSFSEQTHEPPDTESLIPWCDLKHPCKKDGSYSPWTPGASADCLPDDRPCDEYWDTRNFKRDSPWNTWDYSTQQSPTISVLVLELLGEPCSDHWESHWDEPSKGLKEDLTAVMEDVSVHGLVHNDVTAFNFLRFTGDSAYTPQARSCPRHNVVHGWRVIDFDRSIRVDMEYGTDEAKEDPSLYNSADIGSSATFWGNCL